MIDVVVRPSRMKGALARPEAIHEIQALLLDAGDVGVQAGQGMESSRSRKQIRNRGRRRGKETAFGMAAGEQPLAQLGAGPLPEMPQQRGRCHIAQRLDIRPAARIVGHAGLARLDALGVFAG